MAKIAVGQFAKEVRQEAAKVTWPTRKETLISLLMVIIMVAIAGTFFFFVDLLISKIVTLTLGI